VVTNTDFPLRFPPRRNIQKMHSLMRCDRRHVKLSMHKSQTGGLFEGGHKCAQMCTFVHKWPQVCTSGHKWAQVCTNVHKCVCTSPAYSSTYQVYLHPAHSTSYRRLICILHMPQSTYVRLNCILHIPQATYLYLNCILHIPQNIYV
jgi:hypothetical protein